MKMQPSAQHALYPPARRRRFSMPAVRRYTIWALALSFFICGIVNIAQGGPAWALLVLLSEYIFYQLFLTRDLFENTLMQKLTLLLFATCALLVCIGLLYETEVDLLETAVPMTVFGVLCVNALLYFFSFQRQRKNVLPLFHMLAGALCAFFLGISGPWGLNWPRILLLCFSAAVCGAIFLRFRAEVLLELQKVFRA